VKSVLLEKKSYEEIIPTKGGEGGQLRKAFQERGKKRIWEVNYIGLEEKKSGGLCRPGGAKASLHAEKDSKIISYQGEEGDGTHFTPGGGKGVLISKKIVTGKKEGLENEVSHDW